MRCFIIFMLLWLSYAAPAQTDNYPKMYLLDQALQPVEEMNKSSFILVLDKLANNSYQFNYYHSRTRKLHVVETYKTEDGDSAHGRFSYYNNDGYLDSTGLVIDGKRSGNWDFYNPDKTKYDSIVLTKKYEQGVLISKNRKPYIYDTTQFKRSVFPSSFGKFLERNLTYPPPALEAKISGRVALGFLVQEDGSTTDYFLVHSAHYYLDKETIRVIKKSSGKWAPATYQGATTAAYHIQPITFVIPE